MNPSIMSDDIVGPTVLQWAFDLLVVLLGRKLCLQHSANKRQTYIYTCASRDLACFTPVSSLKYYLSGELSDFSFSHSG